MIDDVVVGEEGVVKVAVGGQVHLSISNGRSANCTYILHDLRYIWLALCVGDHLQDMSLGLKFLYIVHLHGSGS